MAFLDDFKAKNPSYQNVPNDKLADGLYNKFYAQKMSRDEFNTKVGGATVSPPAAATAQAVTSAVAPVVPDTTGQTVKPLQEAPSVAMQPKPAISPQAASVPEQGGLLSDLSDTFSKRFQQAQGIVSRADTEHPISTGLQGLGTLAGTAAGVVGNIGEAAFKALPEGIKEKVSGGVQKVMSSPMGQAAIEAAKRGGLEYVKFAEQNPEAARNIEALVDIGSFIPARAATKGAMKVAEVAAAPVPVAGPLIKGAKVPAVEALRKESTAMGKSASGKIDAAKVVNFHPDMGKNLTTQLDSVVDLTNAAKTAEAPGTLDAIKNLKTQLGKGDNSLDTMIVTRNALSKVRSMGGPDGNYASNAIKKLDESIRAAAKNKQLVSGDKKNVDSLFAGLKEYENTQRYDKVVSALSSAKGDAKKIKARMQHIVDSADFQYYKPEVQKLVRKAASGKTSGNILQVIDEMAGKLPFIGAGAIGFAAGGPAGAVIGAALGQAGKMATQKASGTIAKGTVGDILTAIKKSK